ncbi:4598_t:CDS:1, partial [Ambispora gerdemannii]
HESVNQPLFGESSTTDNLLMIYETILNSMLETCVNDFDMEDVRSEIAKQVPIGCNTSPPNVVILKPGDPPNCNDNVHAACEMYRDDLPRGSNDHLYIVCNQAIFGRLISYKEIHKD